MTNPFRGSRGTIVALAALYLAGTFGTAVAAAPKARVKRGVPSEQQIKQMTRNTLLAWNKAVQTRDFKPFYAGAATVWKKRTTPREIRRAFQKFIDRKIDISSIRKLEPHFEPRPHLTKRNGRSGFLEVDGSYETKPGATQFQLTYVNEQGVWKIAGICVHVDSESYIAIDGD